MPQRSLLALFLLVLAAFTISCRSMPEATGSDVDPAAIEASIRTGIAGQYPGETFSIGVDVTEDGVVTLSGTVEDDMRRQKIGEIARDVADVRRVINDLRVE